MIRKLVLIRHGDAEGRRLGETDFQRRLTPSGLRALKEAYPSMLIPLADDLDELQVWSSEAVRARQTAEVACDALGVASEAIEFHQSLYAQDYDGFFGELAVAEGVVVAVGHIPFMEELCSDLAGRAMAFPKGSVACFDMPGGVTGRATLLWFERGPKVW
ncbi:MAG: histidine phosphatase family protein [Acidobacteriota bacterium]|nr:histidine phosphatase family protein [Acidobacteriota bacterium]